MIRGGGVDDRRGGGGRQKIRGAVVDDRVGGRGDGLYLYFSSLVTSSPSPATPALPLAFPVSRAPPFSSLSTFGDDFWFNFSMLQK